MSWEAWYANIGWHYIAYRRSGMSSATLNLLDFMATSSADSTSMPWKPASSVYLFVIDAALVSLQPSVSVLQEWCGNGSRMA